MCRLRVLDIPDGDAVLDLLPTLQQALAGAGPAWLPVRAGDSGGAAAELGAGGPLAPGEDDETDPTAFVIATSGSAGASKGVLLPVSALSASADATRCFLTCTDGHHPHRSNAPPPVPRPRSGHWLLALPADHIAGLQVLLRSVAEDTAPTVLDLGPSFTATRFTETVARMPGGRRFTSLVPTQLHRILADPEATAALAGFDRVLVGGSSTPDDLLDRARAAHVRVATTYGMSETCGGCVYDGRPLDQVALRLRSERPGQPGQVSITGPMVARGYRGRPGDPAFGADDLGVGHHRTFHTKDLAITEGPNVRIVGRSDDVIITGGIKIAPDEIEAILRRVPGVADVAITSVPDPEWGGAVVAVIVADGSGPDPDVVARAAVYAGGPASVPKHQFVVDALPRRGIGKLDRTALAALARARLASP